MRDIIDYFFNIKTFKSSISKDIFGIYHLSILMMLFLLFLLLQKIRKNQTTLQKKYNFIKIISIALLVLESVRILNYMIVLKYPLLNAISWHLCAVGVYLVCLLGFLKKQWIFDAVVLHALIGAPLAILIPYGVYENWNVLSFMPIQSFITHFLLIYVVVYAYQENIYQISRKRFYIPILSILVSVVLAYSFSQYNISKNIGVSFNFLWTVELDSYFLFFTKIPHPYYIFVLVSLFLGVGYFIYFRLEYKSLQFVQQENSITNATIHEVI